MHDVAPPAAGGVCSRLAVGEVHVVAESILEFLRIQPQHDAEQPVTASHGYPFRGTNPFRRA